MTLCQSPAETFHPGEYLRDELEERGWTVTEFADIIGRPVQAVSEILDAEKGITPNMALSLSEALGTSAEVMAQPPGRVPTYTSTHRLPTGAN